MSVIMLNGSPHKEGCTYTALTIIAKELKDQGIDSEIIWLGSEPVRGCVGCGSCASTAKCVYNGDNINAIAERLRSAEGYVFGAAVHYASPNGSMVAAMDRLFYSAGRYMKNKPAAAVVSARRAGTTASLEVLNKYITINNMIMVPSTYWNMVHGSHPEDVLKDEEGVSVMRAVGSNMAWLVKLLRSAKGTELESPVAIPKARTNFIR
ncbi:MAG: flavodoxin family protein [Clostridia bacterium]|nr:flavodoxin family protein [Clostridia bacterium]